MEDIKLFYCDDAILVALKPPGMPSQMDKTGDEDIVSLLFMQLEKKEGKKSNYLALINRLDRPVGGIMVFARTKEAAASLSKQLTLGEIKKTYMAAVCGEPAQKKGELRDFLVKNQKNNLSQVVSKNSPGAKEAILRYEMIKTSVHKEFGAISLLEISLLTGRHHQIRVQLKNAGFPLWGDQKYNPLFQKRAGKTQLGLFSSGLSFFHTITKEQLCFFQPPEGGAFDLF